MQIERNGDSTDTTNHDEQAQDTGAFETNDHPLEEGQDQIVIALDLRRQDPSNPDGSPAPDLAFVLSGGDMSKGQDLSFHLDGIAEIFGMDPALSRIGFTKVVDFEPGTGSATLDEFRQIVNPPVDNSDQGSPTEVVEVATEQPIEDVPHDQGPEDESLSEPAEDTGTDETEEAPAPDVDEPATEDAPTGDSVTTSPGPVDPPSEG